MSVYQLPNSEVRRVLSRFRFRLPRNVNRPVSRWHLGVYYGYGNPESWIPLNSMGGMATKPWYSHTVRFPPAIDAILRAMIHNEREALKKHPKYVAALPVTGSKPEGEA